MKRWNLWIITLMGIAAVSTPCWAQQDEEEFAEARQREAVRREIIAVQSAKDAARASKEIAEEAAAEAAAAALMIKQEATNVFGSQAGELQIFSSNGNAPFASTGPAAMHWAHAGGQPSAEQMKLMKELKTLGKKYQTSDSEDDKSKAKQGMREILGQQYDAFLETQDKQIEELEARIEELRSKLAKRREAKDRMVDLKLEMLISEADGLGWPDNVSNVFFFNKMSVPATIAPEPALAPSAPRNRIEITIPDGR
jgi:hypothetical protein